MGEYITATITMIDDRVPHGWQKNIVEDLATLSGYDGKQFVHDIPSQTIAVSELKWASFLEDLENLSKIYPPIRMEMLVEHGSGAQTMVYAYGGKIQVEPGRVEFNPCTLWS